MRLKELLSSLKYALSHPSLVHSKVKELRLEKIFEYKKIDSHDFSSFCHPETEVKLSQFSGRDGNVSYFELLVLSNLIAEEKPKTLLELGTFDGNTTLQMALNAPSHAVIHTLDLPDQGEVPRALEENEIKYVKDLGKKKRKFEGTFAGKKVVQHFGDSMTYDFSLFGEPEFVFIDASHSYTCVKSDTKKVLNIVPPGGVIMWHDYTPAWPGVYCFLNELTDYYPLIHLTGTNLVYLKKG